MLNVDMNYGVGKVVLVFGEMIEVCCYWIVVIELEILYLDLCEVLVNEVFCE